MTNREASEVLKASSIQQIGFCKVIVDGKLFSVKEALDTAIEALEQQPCEDCISRQSIKRRLQEHHDFFIHAYNGFTNMPQNDKSRVDEITNCIAMIVNEPSITPQPKIGRWIYDKNIENWRCSECNETPKTMGYVGTADFMAEHFKYCNNCGAKMQEVEE